MEQIRTLSLGKFELPPDGGGAASGLALRYGTLIAGYEEVVTQGAFEDTITRFIRGHDSVSPILGLAMLTNAGEDYNFEVEFAASQWAQDARDEVKLLMGAGLEPDVSLGFRVLEYRAGDELTAAERAIGAWGAIDKAEAHELSLVIDGAAPGAMVERAASYREALAHLKALVIDNPLTDVDNPPTLVNDAPDRGAQVKLLLARRAARIGG